MSSDSDKQDWVTTVTERYTDTYASGDALEMEVVYKHLLCDLFFPTDYVHTRDAVFAALTKKIAHAWSQRVSYRPEEGEVLADSRNWDQLRTKNMAHTAEFMEIATMTVSVKMRVLGERTYLALHYTLVTSSDVTSSSSSQLVVNYRTKD